MLEPEVKIKAYQPLQLNVLNASQMILPPVAGQLDSATVAIWETAHAVVYGDIRRHLTNYYWAITTGVTGAVPPVHTDGDASDGTVLWRKIRWQRRVVTLINVAGAGSRISIAHGTPAVDQCGVVLYGPGGSQNEGYDSNLRPYQGAWYAISDNVGGRLLAITEG